MKHLGFDFEIRSVEDTGRFVGLASTYSPTPDLAGDVIECGAFTRTLAEKGGERPLLWAYDLSAPGRPAAGESRPRQRWFRSEGRDWSPVAPVRT